MGSHPYGLRSRLNTQTPSLRTTPTASPVLAKPGPGLSRKTRPSDVTLKLERVIGTTTNSPNGLTCCSATDSYAYCAGAVAVLAKVESDNIPSHRYFKARPTAPSLNPPTSHYESSPATTPSKRRSALFTPRKGQDDYNGGSFGREWLEESGGGQTWTARERIKTASCVSLSRDGRWLAVGESGYNPRVLLFSTAEDASCDVPTSIVSDHTHGVRCVAFSSDMKFLATLGNLSDGFLFVWSINAKTGQLALHSANKCTTNICDMTWCGNNLITVGTRHIKIWQIKDPSKQSPTRRSRFRPADIYPSSPGPAPLQGRNCLLGSMVDSTFTCVASIDETLAVIGTETGHLCLVDISQNMLELKVLKKMNFSITSAAFVAETNRLLMGTSQGLHSEDFDSLRKLENQMAPKTPQRKPSRLSSIRRSLGLLHQTGRCVMAIGTLSDHTITLDNDGSLQIQRYGIDEQDQFQPTFAAHNSVVLGVQTLPELAALGHFYTWSKNGEIKFWNSDGVLLNQEHLDLDETDSDGEHCENELSRMRYSANVGCFVAGDRFGLLKLIKCPDWRVVHTIRAHSAEITGMTVHDPESLAATCSRDRMVQLFRIDGDHFELLQTMDDHVGSVNQVLFAQHGEKLFSCSTDRSLIIRDRVFRQQDGVQTPAYLSTKVLTLKGSPLSMTISAENMLIVSTMDRRVTQVDFSTGTLMDSFKVGDSESDDTVFLNSIICSSSEATDGSPRLLIGYCSMDKSIRVYNEKNLTLLGRESGHTEGVSDINFLDQSEDQITGRRCTIVSTGLDGTIMIWSVSKTLALTAQDAVPERTQGLGISAEDSEMAIAKPSPASLPPLRKVLTKLDVAELTRASGLVSPASPRSLSPVRLKRKTSKLALSTTMEDVEETPSKMGEAPVANGPSPSTEKTDARRSPSPPVRMSSRPKKQRSKTELSKDLESRRTGVLDRSPSPPPLPISMPSTPKHRQKPNNSRLRRPPSVPSDLRSHALAQGRRQSMSQASDFGSLGMATEQACRMLRTYKKKLTQSKEAVDLDDLEDEVDGLLKIIRERKDRTHQGQSRTQHQETGAADRRAKANAVTASEVNQLAVLLERSNMADSPTTSTTTAKCQEVLSSKA
ncbi:uncharacterized protein Z518_10695 [Rhinocladiella mackenziei CBS 650.93]|uniref:WD repeat protein n=1 Tax=Rhinocladiella mackenziei CBS 650.93 TaxID=1442369 RepID=A0A0D2GN13_9EURO|nr:uncharacterized protein Z518_10695 [Rhinocladiella mackenziei CBS 650.93]KIW99767.1 hypothetical protein Z518_10695 [Rhinocladiella mackenziei CBS 650.93]